MITYQTGAFGLLTLFRLHGSALFKAMTPALLSSAIYVILFETLDLEEDDGEVLLHPYPMAALIAAFTFLLTFRANFAYQRWWESYTAVHAMHSKWMDFATEVAAFHYQADRYDAKKPPAFGSHPEMQDMNRVRKHVGEPTKSELEEQIEYLHSKANKRTLSLRYRVRFLFGLDSKRRKAKKQNRKKSSLGQQGEKNALESTIRHLQTKGGLDPNKPSLFLEEIAHLLSLLSAVAMSTLRNDLEDAESPLIEFQPGEPWPHVDPDDFEADVRSGWRNRSEHRLVSALRFMGGISRTETSRVMYNCARPFRVIANVSDAEIELLQAARGPQAKVNLVSLWIQELISREYLSGSTGRVAPPIISRLYQFISDGMLAYNNARRIAYTPFPFVHAQLTTFFVVIIMGFMPIVMLTYLENEAFGFILNLLTVGCFTGLHEVARELESPFTNVPNDIPLNNFQGQFNEALMVMFLGYNPDFFWKPSEEGSNQHDVPAGVDTLLAGNEDRSDSQLIRKND